MSEVIIAVLLIPFGLVLFFGAWWVIEGQDTRWIKGSRNRPTYERIALAYEKHAEEYMKYGYMQKAEACFRQAAAIRKEGLQKMMDGDIDGI